MHAAKFMTEIYLNIQESFTWSTAVSTADCFVTRYFTPISLQFHHPLNHEILANSHREVCGHHDKNFTVHGIRAS